MSDWPAVIWVVRGVAPSVGSMLRVDEELIWSRPGDVFGPRPYYRVELNGIDPTVFRRCNASANCHRVTYGVIPGSNMRLPPCYGQVVAVKKVNIEPW